MKLIKILSYIIPYLIYCGFHYPLIGAKIFLYSIPIYIIAMILFYYGEIKEYMKNIISNDD